MDTLSSKPTYPEEEIEAGFGGLVVNGHILYSEHLSGTVHSKIRQINGHTQSYDKGDRLIMGRVLLDEALLSSFEDGTNLVIVGNLNIPDVLSN